MADIGSLLRETRIRNKIDITTVEEATKIRAKYLRALENEEWMVLPGPTYVQRSCARTRSSWASIRTCSSTSTALALRSRRTSRWRRSPAAGGFPTARGGWGRPRAGIGCGDRGARGPRVPARAGPDRRRRGQGLSSSGPQATNTQPRDTGGASSRPPRDRSKSRGRATYASRWSRPVTCGCAWSTRREGSG